MDYPAHFGTSLNSVDESVVKDVRLYPSRAQVTRTFKLNIHVGQNEVTIFRLPNSLDSDMIRVEGRGNATITSVSSFLSDRESQQTSSKITELEAKRVKAASSLARCQKAREAIANYISGIDIGNLDISKLGEAMDIYDTAEEKWDDKIVELDNDIAAIDKELEDEHSILDARTTANNKLRYRAIVSLFAQTAGSVELDVTYTVGSASWKTVYDIRVDTQKPNAPIKVVYKAIIMQKSGEDWKDAAITLETATPALGATTMPRAWYIDVQAPKATRLRHTAKLSRFLDVEAEVSEEESTSSADEVDDDEMEPTVMPNAEAAVIATGSLNATFNIAGKVNIPSGDGEHGVTIAELDLDAKLRWVCVPMYNVQVCLKALVTNSSPYTLLRGSCNVFVDGSFLATSYMSYVSPQGTFECDLGIDRSIYVAYNTGPQIVSESGFYSKSKTYSYTRRITVHNTKVVGVAGLKVSDHIPVSKNANIVVNLVQPKLKLPSTTAAGDSAGPTVAHSACVEDGVVAQWHGADDVVPDAAALGKDGCIDWVCTLPPHSKITLVLHWEVVATSTIEITGL